MDYKSLSLTQHQKYQGKIAISSKFPKIRTKKQLSVAYTPGVAAVSSFLAQHPEQAANYSIKGNTIAVVSDGSAVLGLGNIGPLGALPVMEGKALLFKEFGGVDAFPIVLNTQDPDEIVAIVKAIAPTFGGINLEDISAPRCFEIEERLIQELDIPIFHDDQHGTAIVILAALINSLKLAGKEKSQAKVVVCGAGAAGIATTKLLVKFGITHCTLVDSTGAISSKRTDLHISKKNMLAITNPHDVHGDLTQALVGADVFIGVSTANILKPEDIKLMASKPIIFAMANPNPEIMPDLAHKAGAFIVGTGRSDFANQINNVLVFPGLFRGLLDYRINKIADDIKIAVAHTLANYLPTDQINSRRILPSILDRKVSQTIAQSLEKFKV